LCSITIHSGGLTLGRLLVVVTSPQADAQYQRARRSGTASRPRPPRAAWPPICPPVGDELAAREDFATEVAMAGQMVAPPTQYELRLFIATFRMLSLAALPIDLLVYLPQHESPSSLGLCFVSRIAHVAGSDSMAHILQERTSFPTPSRYKNPKNKTMVWHDWNGGGRHRCGGTARDRRNLQLRSNGRGAPRPGIEPGPSMR
jgi:hypothetical protein